jgi:hypothetical protein
MRHRDQHRSREHHSLNRTVTMTFTLPSGPRTVRVRLRPDLSGPASAKHVLRLAVASAAKNQPPELAETAKFEFYRAERGMLLQGGMAHPKVSQFISKGPCPNGVDGAAVYKDRTCFPHDPQCGCHGPIMHRGMVGWAGGRGGGPDFFIYLTQQPADFWSHDHTVFGMIETPADLAFIDEVCDLPVRKEGLTMLQQKLPFQLRLLSE